MADRPPARIDTRRTVGLALVAGFAALAIAMVSGAVPWLFTQIATPPPILRAALAGAAIVIGGRLLLSATRRIDASMRRDTGLTNRISDADLGAMVRGVRLVFLAVAALAAGAGWILGHPLPLVVALVIAGVDVLETSFLLLVVNIRSRD